VPDDDLLTRLRDWPCGRADCGSTVCNLLREAAAELGRLNALVNDRCALISAVQRALGITVTDGQDWTAGQLVRWCAYLAAENARLRDAVRGLADPARTDTGE
jgi:hypothetical protein